MSKSGYVERAAKMPVRFIRSDHFQERMPEPERPCRRATGDLRDTPGLTFEDLR
jgi:hypothetical protein